LAEGEEMKVAIDAGPFKSLDSVRGIGVYTRLLTEHLKKIKDIDLEIIDAQKEDLSKFDIVHYQRFHPYFFSIPFTKKIPSVVTIHDLIYLIYPKHYPPGIKGKLRFLAQKPLVKKMDAIITVSETSKKDIVRFLGIPAEKIFVTHLASEEMFKKLEDPGWKQKILKRYKLPNRFVLNVGDVNYNKNILGLAEACKMVGIPLVIVGKQAASRDFDRGHPENRPLVRLLEKYGQDKDILRIGFVEDEDLVGIYNLATVYCQPSFYEGFGLSVLKAFACGVPVVAAKIQALVEIGEPACLFFDPKSPKDMADKISKVVKDDSLKNQLIETGKVLIKNYSWDKTARQTAAVYRKVLAK
jgi:glycosyltransferase involved in cell wall biosynthesis